MNNWESLFREHILERGYDYFKGGRVDDLTKTADGFRATVDGTDDYEVEIKIKDNKVSMLDCTCPYADGGSNCKHMAAVLYYIENKEDKSFKQVEIYDRKQEIKTIIDKMTEEESKNFLLDLAVEDFAFGNRIIAFFSKSIGQSEVNQLKKEVDSIVYSYEGREGFIYYSDANDFVNEIEVFLYQKGQGLIDNKFNMQAFEVISYVFTVIGNINMDDSDGGISTLADSCCELWEDILTQCDEDEKKAMFQWFRSLPKSAVNDYMEEYISDFMMNNFDDKEFLLQKLEDLDKRIARFETDIDADIDEDEYEYEDEDGYEYEFLQGTYEYQNSILDRLSIMKKLGLSTDDIGRYRQKYRNFSVVRKEEICEYLKQKDYDKTIELLIESKELDKAFPSLVEWYSQTLVEIYEKLNMKQEYKEELIYLVFTYVPDDLKYLKKLKQCCPKEWDNYREKLLLAPKAQFIKYELLKEEQMYSRLLDEILKNGSVYYLDQYEKCLKKEFPKELKDAYLNHVIQSVEHATDRKAYKRLTVYLKKIMKYPESKNDVAKVVENWKIQYKRKSAMMDELRKAGF